MAELWANSKLVLINVVAVRWARLMLGWVTICGWVNHLSMSPAA